ncbi:MAG: cold shock domain-containing protein [Bacteroidales bacterium]|nr:cold shock domain-containing protein [Bacteroidales bacterium]
MKDEKTGTDYFVHSSGLKSRIRDNDEVTFDLEQGRRGLNAVNVKLA